MQVLKCDMCDEVGQVGAVEHCQICGKDLCYRHRWSEKHAELHNPKAYSNEALTKRF